MARFVQTLPPLPDVLTADHVLTSTLARLLGDDGWAAARPLLAELAADVAGPLRAAHADAEAHPPVLHGWDGWGRRVDRVETAPGWELLRAAAARHGLVALPHEEAARSRWGAGARLVQLGLLHLYAPESATFSCPVAMSDGAAVALGDEDVSGPPRDLVLPRLLARDPALAWTSGQWMTESQGGSDVGRAETAACRSPDGAWRLTGEKWFCSSITSEVAVSLARPEGAPPGTAGLACFVVPRFARDAGVRSAAPGDPAPGLVVHRLKDKLGTRGMASAEVGLDGAMGWPLGDPVEPGFRRMLAVVEVTRLHNAAAAAAGMRRGLALVRSHAAARVVAGGRLDRQPLHRETLAWLAVDAEGAFALTALAFGLLGRVEVDRDPEARALLRLAAPLAKALTGTLAVSSASAYVECFGGPGYIEDTGVPRLLRDAQVLPIWEGTTAIQALDVVRALADPRVDTLGAVTRRVDAALAAAAAGDAWVAPLAADCAPVRDAALAAARAAAARPTASATQAGARDLTTRLATLLAAAALLEQASYDAGRGDTRAALVASLWIRRRLLGDPATGDGHRGFAHVVDGAPL